MRAALLLLAALAPVPTTAAAPVPPASPVPAFTTAGAFFALSVPDARASAKWYQEKLGLAVVMDPPKQDRTKVVVLEGGGLIVELIQDDDAAAPAARGGIQVHGIVKAGVVVADFDATLATLRQRKAEIAYGPYPAGKGQRANAIVRDGDGNLIQFFGRSAVPGSGGSSSRGAEPLSGGDPSLEKVSTTTPRWVQNPPSVIGSAGKITARSPSRRAGAR